MKDHPTVRRLSRQMQGTENQSADQILTARDWSISGYRACAWNAANFNFVAVSTLSDHDLDDFTDQIREQPK